MCIARSQHQSGSQDMHGCEPHWYLLLALPPIVVKRPYLTSLPPIVVKRPDLTFMVIHGGIATPAVAQSIK